MLKQNQYNVLNTNFLCLKIDITPIIPIIMLKKKKFQKLFLL